MRVLLTASRVCKHPVVSGLSSWLLSVPTLLCLSFPSCIRLSLLSTDFSPLFSLSFSVYSHPCFYPLMLPLVSSLPSFPGPQLSLCYWYLPDPFARLLQSSIWSVSLQVPYMLPHLEFPLLSVFLFTSHVPVPPPELSPLFP